MKLSEFFART